MPVLAAGGSFGADAQKEKKMKWEILKDRPLVCSEAANRKTQRGPKPERLTENNVIELEASASARPKIDDGLVTNIWFESTL